jgi:predicted dehydrogenase
MVVKQNRYNVPVALLKQALDDGRFGRVLMSQCNVIWNRYPGYYSQSPWLGRKEYEGGALYTQVSHFLDLMIWMFGPLVGASAMTETMMHAIDIEDGGAATLRFENGTIGSLFWTTCAYSRNLEGSILVVGESGIAKVGGTYLNRLEHWNVEGFPVPDTLRFDDRPNSYGKYQGTSSNHDKVIRDVVKLVRGQGGSVVMGDEGRLTVSAIEMIYSSLGRRH